MNWPELGRKIAAGGLPALGAALAGPTGGMVGKVIAERIGAKDADPAIIAQAFAADPEVAARLAELDVEMERERRETLKVVTAAAADEAESNEDNVRAARQSSDLNPARRWMVYVNLAVLVLSLGGLIGVEVAWEIPDMVLGLAVGVVGMLASQYQQMVGFFFGTSSGSAARAAQIERLAEKR